MISPVGKHGLPWKAARGAPMLPPGLGKRREGLRAIRCRHCKSGLTGRQWHFHSRFEERRATCSTGTKSRTCPRESWENRVPQERRL